MTETVEVPKALLERLLDRVDGLEDELKEYRAENERDKATIRQEVTEAVESERSHPDDGESEDGSGGDERVLPIERLAKFGEDHVAVANITASVERAKAIFQHFRGWASKTPSGYVVKGNLKSLLETATGESLYWKQIHRACEKLEQWSKGVISFEKTRRHGWILVADTDWRMSSASGG
jgi:hypothetical protein